ncbi:OsmC family protein [Spirosoma gilvum]
MEAHEYNVNLDWQYARLGRLSSHDLNETIEVATPPEFPKGMPGVWSPEHLLIAAVSSCFMTTFLAVAENSKLNFEDFSCRAIGVLGNVDNKLMISEIKLFPSVLLNHEGDTDKAQRVLQKTEQACLVTNSVKSRVTMEPRVHISIQVYD